MAEPDVRAARPPKSPGFMAATVRVFDLSLSQMLWSRRTIFMALVVGAPVVLAVLFRMLELLSIHSVRVNSVPVSGPVVLGIMIWLLYLRFIVPVLGVFYGTSLVADEVEDKTITYLFTRPIPRGAVLAGKYLAYLASTVMVVLPSVILVFFLVIPSRLSAIAEVFPSLAKDLAILGVGLAVYGALFAFIGALMKYPLVVGLMFSFGWEQLAMLLPGYLRKFTIAYYLQALVPHAMPKDNALTFLQSVFADVPSVASAIAWLLVIWCLSLLAAIQAVERREYILEQ
jgi:ABC-2 type transport system permease protein